MLYIFYNELKVQHEICPTQNEEQQENDKNMYSYVALSSVLDINFDEQRFVKSTNRMYCY